MVWTLEEAEAEGICMEISYAPGEVKAGIDIAYHGMDREQFELRVNRAIEHLEQGDTYLINLTFPSVVETQYSLEDIFRHASAKYKFYRPDDFVIFSPETFVKISENRIHTYPMKGTIDASVENASDILMNDEKEIWEHNTIVDLLRNDLSMVSQNVCVEKYRYQDRILSRGVELLQTSSEIVGELTDNWRSQLAELLWSLTPAGSISGAPKKRTLEIIGSLELDERGYYTGICGRYDGETLDSAVCIRYIEQRDGKLWYRSGGGITANSQVDREYDEMLSKIYVPTF